MSNVVTHADGSAESRVSVQWCADHLEHEDEVVVVYRLSPVGEFVLGLPMFDANDERRLIELLRGPWIKPLEDAGLHVRSIAIPRGPLAAVLETAEREHADLVVVGKRKRGAVLDALAGDLASHLVQHASCPLVIVPVVNDEARGGEQS